MLRQPRKPPNRCTCGTCRVCRDPLVLALNADREARARDWRTADLGAGHTARVVTPNVPRHAAPVRHHQPTADDINRQAAAALDVFGARMDALIREVRGDG